MVLRPCLWPAVCSAGSCWWWGRRRLWRFCFAPIVIPLILRINGVYAAKTIEGADPAFKNSLINYLTLLLPSRQDVQGRAGHAGSPERSMTWPTSRSTQVVNQHYFLRALYNACPRCHRPLRVLLLASRSQEHSRLHQALPFLADVVRPTNSRLWRAFKPGFRAEIVAGIASAILG